MLQKIFMWFRTLVVIHLKRNDKLSLRALPQTLTEFHRRHRGIQTINSRHRNHIVTNATLLRFKTYLLDVS